MILFNSIVVGWEVEWDAANIVENPVIQARVTQPIAPPYLTYRYMCIYKHTIVVYVHTQKIYLHPIMHVDLHMLVYLDV